jgi:hypothetical protein
LFHSRTIAHGSGKIERGEKISPWLVTGCSSSPEGSMLPYILLNPFDILETALEKPHLKKSIALFPPFLFENIKDPHPSHMTIWLNTTLFIWRWMIGLRVSFN